MKAIIGNNVYTPNGRRRACIIIENEVVSEILNELPASFCGEIENVHDLVVMPGLIDPHVHINEPGRTEWEGFVTATKSAAAGGITTLVDMPLNSSPVTTNVHAFAEKINATNGKLWVDCGFWGGVTQDSLDDLPELLKSGVLGIKSFLIDSGISEFASMENVHLHKAMPIIAASGLPYLVHAELDDKTRLPVEKSYAKFLDSRPKSWENKAIEEMIALAQKYNCRVHIVHLSSAEALPMLHQARLDKIPITVETCPHYIVLCAEEIPDAAPIFKCCPPIREKSNNELLWQALKNGEIDFIASDHSPAPPQIKCLDSGNIEKAWGGIASLQFTLPLLWSKGRTDNLSIMDICKMISRTANFIGCGEHKGEISVGKDADFVVWNPDEAFTIGETNVHHRHKCTPYLGREVFGKVYQTYLRGNKIFADNKWQTKPTGSTILRKQ